MSSPSASSSSSPSSSLFPALTDDPSGRPALRFGERSLTYAELAAAAGAVGERVRGAGRVAVWATPSLETAVGVVGVLLAGVAAVPLNPKSGEKELGHILSDSAPGVVLAAPGDELPEALRELERIDVDVDVDGDGVGGWAVRLWAMRTPPSSSTPPAPPGRPRAR